VPPEFKTASVLDTLENPGQDRANSASARIDVAREWNAAKKFVTYCFVKKYPQQTEEAFEQVFEKSRTVTA
jgi:hypothetical protein